MGCCLSTTNTTSPEIITPNDGNGINVSDDETSLTARVAAEVEPVVRRRQSTVAPSHRTSRRLSRHLEHQVQRAQEESGLRPDERVTSPLVRHVWTSKVPMAREELTRKREEFFDTRVTGRAEVWGVLRLVIEAMENGDMETAQEMINASGITVPTGNLIHGAYDERGIRYDLPEYCISAPHNLILSSPEVNKHESMVRDSLDSDDDDADGGIEDSGEIERRRDEKGKRVIHGNEKQYKVVARMSDRGGRDADVAVRFDSGEPLRHIIRQIMDKGGVDPSQARIRIAYLGRMLRENESLQEQGWVEGHVINALVLQTS